MAEILFQLGSHYNCQTLTPLRRAKAVDFTLERVRVGLQLGFGGLAHLCFWFLASTVSRKGAPSLRSLQGWEARLRAANLGEFLGPQ